MSLDDFRRRLERLNRGPLPLVEPATTPAGGGVAVPAVEPKPMLGLIELVAGESASNGDGHYYRVLRRISQCWSAMAAVSQQLVGRLRDGDGCPGDDPDLALLAGVDPEHLLFLDLETCGFSGTPVFLIGLMYVERGDLTTEQLLARNYEEERAILGRLAEVCAERRTLITYNGKSFDWPFVLDRVAISRRQVVQPERHVDLLLVARRRYRGMLPNCRLQTLETHLCNRKRVGDIPGSQIPAAYNEFVRTGDARQIREIVHHNFLDLATMAELLSLMVPARTPGSA